MNKYKISIIYNKSYLNLDYIIEEKNKKWIQKK